MFGRVFHGNQPLRETNEGELLRQVREGEVRVLFFEFFFEFFGGFGFQVDSTRRRVVLEKHALRRLFLLLDDGG